MTKLPIAALVLTFLLPAAAPAIPNAWGGDTGWPTYGFTYANTRHVDLDQINAANVAGLTPVWRFDMGFHGRMETSPIVIGKTMYVTTGGRNEVIALDAATGTLKWRYTPVIGYVAPCCGLPNRGVAVDGGRVFFATMDGRLIALDARTGRKIWDVAVGSAHDGFSETMAPLAWRGMVFIGSSGGDYGIRGSFTAYRQHDGKMVWRWWTVSPGWEGSFVTTVRGLLLHRDIAREKADTPKYRTSWMHGGGAVWLTPALDPAHSTIYLSTGNPSPSLNAQIRPGDNLYTDSVVALDALRGTMKWYYQETPHDVWDYDAASPPLLFDALDRSGRRVPAVGETGKTGWFYVLDRANGRLIRVSEGLVPQQHIYETSYGAVIRPGGLGGTIGPVSYNPSLHLAFITAFDRPEIHQPGPVLAWQRDAGKWIGTASPPAGYWRTFNCAVNVDTGRVIWKNQMSEGTVDTHFFGATLSAGSLAFVPDVKGTLYGLDAKSGSILWQFNLGAATATAGQNATFMQRLHDWLLPIKRWLFRQPPPQPRSARIDAPPVAYMVGGREYVVITADTALGLSAGGNSVFAFALPR